MEIEYWECLVDILIFVMEGFFPARRDILEKSSVLFEKWYLISHPCQYITKLLGPVLLFADGVSTLV